MFLRYILTKIDEFLTATEIVSSVAIFQAICWTAEGWSIDPAVIRNCFQKAGFQNCKLEGSPQLFRTCQYFPLKEKGTCTRGIFK